MTAIVCELCGSNDIQKQDGLYVCQHCGTKYSVEEARKLLGTVKIDNTERVDNLFRAARRAKKQGDNKNAEKYYSEILTHVPDNWEANYYSIQSKVSQCIIAEIRSAATLLSNATIASLRLIKDNIPDERTEKGDLTEQEAAVSEVASCTIETVMMLMNASISHYNEIDWGIQSRYKEEFLGRMDSCLDCLASLGQEILYSFPKRKVYRSITESAWKTVATMSDTLYERYGHEKKYRRQSDEYDQKLAQISPSHKQEEDREISQFDKTLNILAITVALTLIILALRNSDDVFSLIIVCLFFLVTATVCVFFVIRLIGLIVQVISKKDVIKRNRTILLYIITIIVDAITIFILINHK